MNSKNQNVFQNKLLVLREFTETDMNLYLELEYKRKNKQENYNDPNTIQYILLNA